MKPRWVWAPGSSPLARGLPFGLGWSGARSRIIPARAGFTWWAFGAFLLSPGSSPLARGLPSPRPGYWTDPGIIPARAGFTRTFRCNTAKTWDHPRSRGVYTTGPRRFLLTTGSSPLARGLLAYDRGSDGKSRIIPARAGFTDSPRDIIPENWDHPRSRGVYEYRELTS